MDRALVWTSVVFLSTVLLLLQLVAVGIWQEQGEATVARTFRPHIDAMSSALEPEFGEGSQRVESQEVDDLAQSKFVATMDSPEGGDTTVDVQSDMLVVWSSGDSTYQLWQSALLACSLKAQGEHNFLRILHRNVNFRRHRQAEQRRYASRRFPHTDRYYLIDRIPTFLTRDYSYMHHDNYVPYNRILGLRDLLAHLRSTRSLGHVKQLCILDPDMICTSRVTQRARDGSPLGSLHVFLDVTKMTEFVEGNHTFVGRAWAPLLITLDDLERILQCWEGKTARIREATHNWIAEMWAYNLCASEAGIQHRYVDTLQVLPPAGPALADAHRFNFFHYAYPLEVGSWRWDKHDFLRAESTVPGPIELGGSQQERSVVPPGISTFVSVFNHAMEQCDAFKTHDWRA